MVLLELKLESEFFKFGLSESGLESESEAKVVAEKSSAKSPITICIFWVKKAFTNVFY